MHYIYIYIYINYKYFWVFFLVPSKNTNVALTSKVHLKIKFYLLDVVFINNLLK